MLEATCDTVQTPVESMSPAEQNPTIGPLTHLTQVVHSGPCWQQAYGGVFLPTVKLTVRLSFASGEEIVTSAETPAVYARSTDEAAAPYTFSGPTEQPVLVSSSDFVEFK